MLTEQGLQEALALASLVKGEGLEISLCQRSLQEPDGDALAKSLLVGLFYSNRIIFPVSRTARMWLPSVASASIFLVNWFGSLGMAAKLLFISSPSEE